MLRLDAYRAAIVLDEAPRIEPLADWQEHLPSMLAELGIVAPLGATTDAMVELLRGALASLGPNMLPDDLVRRIEAVAVGARSQPPVTIDDLPTIAAEPPRNTISLWVGDITRLEVGAIVNAANSTLLGCRLPNHPCIDSVIHSGAGPRLRDDCATIMEAQGEPEPVGSAKITRAYALPARYVIHTVGPQLVPGSPPTTNERAQLASCYRACLDLAAEVEAITTMAFCGISTGVFAFPRAEAAEIALATIEGWIAANPNRFTRIVIDCFTADDASFYEAALRRS